MEITTTTRVEFDRQAVLDEMGKRGKGFLNKFGEYVVEDAKASIKRSVSGESSKPGEPPKSHTGRLKEGIAYAFDDQSKAVVAGAVRHPGRKENIPLILETGGYVARRAVRYATDSYTKFTIKTGTAYIWNEATKASWRSGGWGKAGAVVLIAARPFIKPAMDRAIYETVRFWEATIEESWD